MNIHLVLLVELFYRKNIEVNVKILKTKFKIK